MSDDQFAPWNYRSLALSFPGRFAPWPSRSLEFLLPQAKWPGNFIGTFGLTVLRAVPIL